ncbi:unnamed protein product, partial [Ilex paraguariensis]
VAPLEIHKENLLDAEEQLRFLGRIIGGAKIDYFLPLLKGSFSSWIWNSLGIPPGSICPSVRCGLEMAVLNAIAAREGCRLCCHYTCRRRFSAIKLKVARRADPIEDAAVIQEVRKKVGHQIELRADANRKWTYDEAIRFGFAVKNCDLQYIEEPVSDEDDIIKFCEETGLPVALDETLDNIADNHLEVLAKFTHSRIVAVVIKPSIVGGFENAALIARWAQQHGKMAVVSAAFESGLGLLAYIQFSSYVELQNAALCRVMNKEPALSVIHGLGTYRWLKEDVTTEPLKICRNPRSGFVEASIVDAVQLLQKFQINKNVIVRTFTREQVRNYQLSVDSEHFSFSFNIQESGPSIDVSKDLYVIRIQLYLFIKMYPAIHLAETTLENSTTCLHNDRYLDYTENIGRRYCIEHKSMVLNYDKDMGLFSGPNVSYFVVRYVFPLLLHINYMHINIFTIASCVYFTRLSDNFCYLFICSNFHVGI